MGNFSRVNVTGPHVRSSQSLLQCSMNIFQAIVLGQGNGDCVHDFAFGLRIYAYSSLK